MTIVVLWLESRTGVVRAAHYRSTSCELQEWQNFTTFLGYLVFFKPLDALLERALGKRVEFRFVIALQFAELDFS